MVKSPPVRTFGVASENIKLTLPYAYCHCSEGSSESICSEMECAVVAGHVILFKWETDRGSSIEADIIDMQAVVVSRGIDPHCYLNRFAYISCKIEHIRCLTRKKVDS